MSCGEGAERGRGRAWFDWGRVMRVPCCWHICVQKGVSWRLRLAAGGVQGEKSLPRMEGPAQRVCTINSITSPQFAACLAKTPTLSLRRPIIWDTTHDPQIYSTQTDMQVLSAAWHGTATHALVSHAQPSRGAAPHAAPPSRVATRLPAGVSPSLARASPLAFRAPRCSRCSRSVCATARPACSPASRSLSHALSLSLASAPLTQPRCLTPRPLRATCASASRRQLAAPPSRRRRRPWPPRRRRWRVPRR